MAPSWPATARSLGDRGVTALRRRLRIDLRSLAAFRAGLGLLLVADLLLRARDLRAFYTDGGVLSRTAFIESANPLHLSVHVVTGSVWGQALLFALAVGFALALAVGYRTRLATLCSWLLLVSLHNRGPDLLNGGDVLLRLALFWALFLPLGARWAVDSIHRGDTDRSTVGGVAAAALLLQVVVMYVTNAAFKHGGELWANGQALAYVFSLEQFTVLLGDHLGAYPPVLELLTYLWLAMVTLSALLVVLTGWERVGFVALFAGMHLGMALTMKLGLFPFVVLVALLPFLPGVFWDHLLPHLRGFAAATERAGRGLADALPAVAVGSPAPVLARLGRSLRTLVPLVMLVLVVLWNLQVLGAVSVTGVDPLPEEGERVLDVTRTDQYWNMFAPGPYRTDGWVVAPGRLENGTERDAFHGGAVRWGPPPDVSDTYPTERWRKYLSRLWRYDNADRERFAAYLCDRWNHDHETELDSVEVYFVEQHTRLSGPEPTERELLTEYRCAG